MTKTPYSQVRLDISEESCVVLCKISPCRWRAVALTAEQAADFATGHLLTEHRLTREKVCIAIPQEEPEKVVAVKPVKVNPVKEPKAAPEKKPREPKPPREKKTKPPRKRKVKPPVAKKVKIVDRILATMENGSVSTADIRRATDLPFRTVNMTLNYLRRKGRVERVGGATYALSTRVDSGSNGMGYIE